MTYLSVYLILCKVHGPRGKRDRSNSRNPAGEGPRVHSRLSCPGRSPGVGQLLLCGAMKRCPIRAGGGQSEGKFDPRIVTKGQHRGVLELSGLLVLAACWAWAGPGPALPNHHSSPKAAMTLPLPVRTAFPFSFSTVFSSPRKKLQR